MIALGIPQGLSLFIRIAVYEKTTRTKINHCFANPVARLQHAIDAVI